MSNRKYFGTDGIRARVGSELMSPEFILRLGYAFGKVLKSENKNVLIGKDTRVSGYMLESALEAGLSAAGIDVRLLGPMPTPAIAYLTQTFRAAAGIVISASHNLYEDNGIKFFLENGSKLADDTELAIENEMEKKIAVVPSANLGKVARIFDAPGRYIEFCKSTIPSLTRLAPLKIVVDCANGATYHIAPKVFAELGAEVIAIGNKPDGFNINKNCGSTKPDLLKKHVIKNKADIGIALDGDGDRVIMVNANGEILTGDSILYIIAKDRLERGVLSGGVVGTLMTNFGLEKALQSLNIPMIRTKVGDRYILEALKQNDWRIGGESSGHVVCLDKTTTGDGIVAALQVLAVMIKQGKTLEELTRDLILLPQSLLSLKTDNAINLANHPKVLSAVNDIGSELRDAGRVLLRASGTEPMLRVMVEGQDYDKVQLYAKDLVAEIKKIEQQHI